MEAHATVVNFPKAAVSGRPLGGMQLAAAATAACGIAYVCHRSRVVQQGGRRTTSKQNVALHSSRDSSTQSQTVKEGIATPPSEPDLRSGGHELSNRTRQARKFARASRSYGSIETEAAECRSRRDVWKDPDFPHEDATIFKEWPKEVDRESVSWETPARFCTTRNPVGKNVAGEKTWLYSDASRDGITGAAKGLNESDIEPGTLGDSYFLCALSAAVRDLEVTDDLIDTTYEDAGIYGVSFFIDGRFRMVWVDSYFPCMSKSLAIGGQRRQRWRPLFGHMKDTKDIWTLVVEKAFAKLKGSYCGISGGQPSVALQLLTGGEGGATLLAPVSNGKVTFFRPTDDFAWQILEARVEAPDCFVCASALRSSRNYQAQAKFLKGIVPGHVYHITKVKHVPGMPGTDDLRMIQMRCPWGRATWEGGSYISYDDTEAGLSVDRGCFWMEFSDFRLRFTSLEWCKRSKLVAADQMEQLVQAVAGLHGQVDEATTVGGEAEDGPLSPKTKKKKKSKKRAMQ